MNSKNEFNMILQQLNSLSQDLYELAINIRDGNIDERDDAMVRNLGDFASVIANDLEKVLRKEHQL